MSEADFESFAELNEVDVCYESVCTITSSLPWCNLGSIKMQYFTAVVILRCSWLMEIAVDSMLPYLFYSCYGTFGDKDNQLYCLVL